MPDSPAGRPGLLDKLIRFCLEQKLVVVLMLVLTVVWGLLVAPFDWELGGLPRDPVPVDAIPDIGENQQIVFTEWMGRSPQDVEDQITYPLTVSLLGVPHVRTVRSYSFFGFSSIYVIFEEEAEFYWSRSRVLEKLASLPANTLPEGVQPALGPDSTALGQVFEYTLEGRDSQGNPTGGWDLHELRTIQDWYVRYALLSAGGVSEVASIGGFVQEYQIDVDPDAMRAANVSLDQIFMAVRMANVDVGARTIEVNRVEYVIRGLGFIESVGDIESSVVAMRENVPIYIKDVARVSLGPALRRGALDKEGAETVGGIVVVRYGDNPLEVIKNVKAKIAEIAPGLPKKTLADGRISQVTIVPFYDRTGLIYETLGTLNSALAEEIFVTMIVVIVMVLHLRSSALIAGLLPLAVLMCFILMKLFKVDANIVALSGIAIAIGTMVDMGIVICENILRHLEEASPEENRLEVVYRAATEVGSAVLTAVSTTVVGFLPVFTMEAAEGKLFKPLAYTKTFALVAAIVVALTLIPPFAHVLFTAGSGRPRPRSILAGLCVLAGLVGFAFVPWWLALVAVAFGAYHLLGARRPALLNRAGPLLASAAAVLVVGIILSGEWAPVGPESGALRNFVFVGVVIGGMLGALYAYQRVFEPFLRWCLAHKALFLAFPTTIAFCGLMVWLGAAKVLAPLPIPLRTSGPALWLVRAFPGLGEEFMPPLDEGSFLFMPSTMPHASIGETLDVMQTQDMALRAVPEIDSVVGKLGRADSPLDPAPISMIETIVTYKPEYILDKAGHRVRFAYDEARGDFVRGERGDLVPDPNGRPFRQWRPHIESPKDIWNEITRVTELPGTTSAPMLQPIATRIIMLQSGMRAPMGIKVRGPDLETIDRVGLQLERFLKEVPTVEPSTVLADRIVGKPYLEIDIDREAIARYGVPIRKVQDVIEVAIGGRRITTTVEGRERYPVRVRYQRELRDTIEALGGILVAGADGSQIPMRQLATINYVRGPQMIKSEDTFLVGYVIFDMKPGRAEVDVVEDCRRYLQAKIDSGEFDVPAGVSYTFAGSYENQVRAAKRLAIILPLALFVIFMILYFQFRSTITTFLVFSRIFLAWAGGFLIMWLYAQDWFLAFSVFGTDMRELFQAGSLNLSVAIWVGFLALFGIASDDGVIMGTYLNQVFRERKPRTREEIREAVVIGAMRRVRPCLMTGATTILALLPVLTSSGRGADIMRPMALPTFGGMIVIILTLSFVPVLYCLVEELKLSFGARARGDSAAAQPA